ncbi:MAG: MBOAT family protein, partial [Erysipelotrichaceae bacterium]|nr:MBOAT family protein [Erysipelotrichaceae bacterium]
RNLFNIMVVWMLTGFWHGASWNFLLWGLFYGVVLIIEKNGLGKVLKKMPKFIQHIYTLVLVCIGWVMFALIDRASILNYMGMLFGIGAKGLADGLTLYYLRDNLVLIIVAIVACGPWGAQLYRKYIDGNNKEYVTMGLMVVGFMVCVAFIVDATYNPFLYFRF